MNIPIVNFCCLVSIKSKTNEKSNYISTEKSWLSLIIHTVIFTITILYTLKYIYIYIQMVILLFIHIFTRCKWKFNMRPESTNRPRFRSIISIQRDLSQEQAYIPPLPLQLSIYFFTVDKSSFLSSSKCALSRSIIKR